MTVKVEGDFRPVIEKVISQLLHLRGTINEDEVPIGIVSMNNWEWPQGVALFSLYLYFKETNDPAILDYLLQWYDRKIGENDLPPININTMCPMLALSYIWEERPEDKYLKLCKYWADYALHHLPRTEEGGLQHLVSGNFDNPGELWDDTLYMTVLFLARMGEILDRNDLRQESIRQFLVHVKYLTDVRTGLFFHGWTFEGNNHFAQALWGRGNAWYTAGIVDYLEMVTLPEGVKLFLLGTLQRQLETLEKLQAESGMWHTLLDDPGSYEETSATAAFAYGILKSVRQGFIDPKYADMGWKAFRAVLSKIDEKGVVHGVSYGTGLGRSLDDYRNIPICPMPYGQSMTLLMLVEGMKHHGGESQ
ncbi:glycoside hydrolase family 105 protein [Paenibacillus tarimensis]